MADAEAERRRLLAAYRRYEDRAHTERWDEANSGNAAMIAERDAAVLDLLQLGRGLPAPVVDVGCGDGSHGAQLCAASGSDLDTVVGLDLVRDRLARARHAWGPRFARADASALPLASQSVPLALVFTVLSSVPAAEARSAIAGELDRVLAPDGVLAVYDMRVRSPVNRDVRPVRTRQLARLFPGFDVTTRALTLLPPLARRLGGCTDQLYSRLVQVPFLRTHCVWILRRR